ncbi:hypothetical protein BD1_2 [Octadecabacter Antarctic BD virus 1]|nr:hypothetical protein BD1_2 [Octadecabacter Antarctic BD virus 1]
MSGKYTAQLATQLRQVNDALQLLGVHSWGGLLARSADKLEALQARVDELEASDAYTKGREDGYARAMAQHPMGD